MPSELETAAEEKEFEAAEEPRDRTKFIWLAIFAAFAVMIGALWLTQRPSDTISQARAKHILVAATMGDPTERQQALVRARELRQRLLDGADFESLAKEFSNDPYTSPRGGDLGYSKRDDYETAIDEYVWNAPLNEISDILRSSRGYHIVVVTYRKLSAADEHEQKIRARETTEQVPPAE
ncbi:MAG: peptidylprolyl isomerase [FCB group bacterium]|jgi:parvulin-like peptidyl-prolyl isomerase|nr:peptidylprolyl isomerase [FCB group bacterium]